MIGRDDPVVGTVSRTCNGTAREGERSVIGVIAIVGVASLIKILLALSMRACSARGGDIDCMEIDFRNDLIESCLGTSVGNVVVNGFFGGQKATDLRVEAISYVSANRLGCGV